MRCQTLVVQQPTSTVQKRFPHHENGNLPVRHRGIAVPGPDEGRWDAEIVFPAFDTLGSCPRIARSGLTSVSRNSYELLPRQTEKIR